VFVNSSKVYACESYEVDCIITKIGELVKDCGIDLRHTEYQCAADEDLS
jgi:hypothetical protein